MSKKTRGVTLKEPKDVRRVCQRITSKAFQDGVKLEYSGRIAQLMGVWLKAFELEKLADIERRLEALERARPREEPWPPKEGSLAYAIWRSYEDEPLPEERPKGSVLFYFLEILVIRALEKRVRALEAAIPPKENLVLSYVTKLMTFDEMKEMLKILRGHGEDAPDDLPVAVLFGGLKLAVEDRLPVFRRLSYTDIQARKDRLVAILAQNWSINPVERVALFLK